MEQCQLALGGSFELNQSRATSLAAQQAPTAHAGQQSSATLPVEHRHDGSARLCLRCSSNHRGQPSRVSACTWVFVPGIDHLDRRPSGAFGATGQRDEVPTDQHVEGRTGAHQKARDLGAPGALLREHRGFPGGNAFFLVGVRVSVEDDHGAEIDHRREHRRARADNDSTSRCRLRPRVWLKGKRMT